MTTPAAPRNAFEEARNHFMEGLACLQAGRFMEAEQRFQSSLALQPGRISTLVNLAAVQIELSRPLEALASADLVLAAEADNIDAWFHRGTALYLLDRHDEALTSFDKVLALDSGFAEPWFRRGQVLQSLKRPAQALEAFDRAVTLDPSMGRAWSNRGGILQEMKRLDEAAESFRQALAHGADHELNSYYLAAVGAAGAPAAAPRTYVESLFDDYAGDFDQHLVQVLHYRAHRSLADHLQAMPARRFRSALDLGCGTGLCGPLLAPMVERLAGVDLSNQMLQKARGRGVYHRLVQAEIGEFLATPGESHDLVVAADVFIYVGDLDAIFRGVRSVLVPQGIFCFSAEVARQGVETFELLSSLRYAHSETYLRRLARTHGFEVTKIVHEPIREDQREMIGGIFVYLTPRAV
jgi:predicted TPR repeat methyltransferase